jgi:hypothetical protein
LKAKEKIFPEESKAEMGSHESRTISNGETKFLSLRDIATLWKYRSP